MALTSAARNRNVIEPLILQKLQESIGQSIRESLLVWGDLIPLNLQPNPLQICRVEFGRMQSCVRQAGWLAPCQIRSK
jgi:hypothetical protein